MKVNLLLILSVLSLAAHAEVYRWTDAQGNVHFGDKPPASNNAEEVKLRKAPTPVPGSDPASRLEKQRKLLNAYREERVKEQEARREAEAQQAKQQRRCASARNQLLDYERSTAIYDLDEEGNRVYMDDAQRDAFMDKLRNDIRRYCN